MIKFISVSKSFGARVLLEDASFTMGSGERLALVGRNGSGKSTLFKLILGEEHIDDGTISIPKGYKVGHLAQHLHFTHDNIVAEVMEALPNERQDEEYKAHIILAGLGFSEEDMLKPASMFSGGFQIRINLARLLLSEPNLLLLDEPTNYLDIISARWLIEFLQEWEGEMILISHDREFLDQVATHSMLVYRKGLKKMRGNTADLYAQILQDEERYEATRVNEDKKRKQVEVFINRFRAKASKASQVQSRIKALERLGQKNELQDEDSLEFRFREGAEFHGKFLLEAEKLSFSYTQEQRIISGLSLTLTAGERVAIIGKNGRGKSTLLRLLAGELMPQSGVVKLSPHAQLGYFGQTNINRLDHSLTVEAEIARTNQNLTRTETRSICGAMMFSGDEALKKISVLSGGERSRVLLGKIIAKPTNLLLLDEPTNHLDMESIEALVDTCQAYSGAIAIVTHSEHILRSLATKIIVFNRDGPLLVDGDYDYFLNKVGWEDEDAASPSGTQAKEQSPEVKQEQKRIRKEMAVLESEIAKLEKRCKIEENNLAAASAAVDTVQIIAISKTLVELQATITRRLEELVQLEQGLILERCLI